jgi:hypothetical protein
MHETRQGLWAAGEHDGEFAGARGEGGAAGDAALRRGRVPDGGQEREGGIEQRGLAGEALLARDDDAVAKVCGELAQVPERERGRQRGHGPGEHTPGVPLSRIAWLVTVGICLVAFLLTLLAGYQGYAFVLLAVALSAAINLR